MGHFYEYVKARNSALKEEAKMLKASDRTDEATFARVKANIYEICGTVCKVQTNRTENGNEVCREQFEKFRTLWTAEKERAAAHGDAEKEAIEEVKLSALEDAVRHFEEAME